MADAIASLSCTVRELMDIITEPYGGLTLLPGQSWNEVFPGLFIGDVCSAKCQDHLTKMGITHILNVAKGKGQSRVNTDQEIYRPMRIEFMGVEIDDHMNTKISEHFEATGEFIHSAIKDRGKVLVHCKEGVSRSATIVMAYLMTKHHMTVQDAIRFVRKSREICPNEGFLQQLCDLNDQLQNDGHFKQDKDVDLDIMKMADNLKNVTLRAKSDLSTTNGVKVKEEGGCTVEELTDILTAPSGGMMMLPGKALDEVYPGIFVGEVSIARNVPKLKYLGITHVLNCAQGKERYHVNTSAEMYDKYDLEFMGIEATDCHSFQISKYFEETKDFIQSALDKNGKVLVHCQEGVSRAATIALAYLMLQHHMTAQEAIRLVREKREISPNNGFLQELCDLNDKLYKKPASVS